MKVEYFISQVTRALQKQAVGKIKRTLMRMMRGDVGMRVYIWRGRVKAIKDAEMANKLASRMKTQGLNKLKDTMMRMVRGQVGMLLYVWGSQMKREVEESRRERAAAALSSKMMAKVRGQAISKLKVTFARISR